MSEEMIDQFILLFRGRGDAYGNAKGFCVHEPLTRAIFKQHLTSLDPSKHIGVYCMVGEMCSWGCIDIDGKDFPKAGGDSHDWDRMHLLARNLQKVLAVKHVHSNIEQTKNGYHVWVFPEQPLVPARAMRRALMAACKAVGYDPKEVNPKAEGPRAGTKGLGNFVRLPYGGGLAADWKPMARFMTTQWDVARFNALTLADYLGMAPRRTSLAALEAVAALWSPPPVPHHEVDYEAGLDVEHIMRLCNGIIFTVWKEGPLEGSDRSTTLAKLGHLCAEHGLTATQAYAILKSADVRWGGKFANRADGAEQLARLVENAYERFAR